MEVAFRLYCGTNGRVGMVMKIVRRAAEHGIMRDAKDLSLDLLAEAYEERIRHDHPDRVNPFSSDGKKLKIEPFEEYVPNIGVSRRGKSGKTGRGGVNDLRK
jgi:hypothetical protein